MIVNPSKCSRHRQLIERQSFIPSLRNHQTCAQYKQEGYVVFRLLKLEIENRCDL